MPDYRVFGLTLRSDLDFPELLPISPATLGGVDLELHIHSGPPPEAAPGARLLGETRIAQDVPVRLWAEPPGFLLDFEDTGTFRIRREAIEWWPAADHDPEASRVDLKGRVLPLVLHLRGDFGLHAAAVALGKGVVAFSGPKRAGKSTLTAALVRDGARLVTDDVLGIVPTDPVLATGGVAAFRLWDDTAEAMDLGQEYRAPGLAGKWNVRPTDPAGEETESPLPLLAVHFLVPAEPEEEVARRRLPEREAALALVANAKNGELLGGSEGGKLFLRAAEIAGRVPCYELRIPRALARISEAVARLEGWHGTGPSERGIAEGPEEGRD